MIQPKPPSGTGEIGSLAAAVPVAVANISRMNGWTPGWLLMR